MKNERAEILQKQLRDVVQKANDLEKEHKGEAMPKDVAEKHQKLCEEGEKIQKELENAKRMKSIKDFADQKQETIKHKGDAQKPGEQKDDAPGDEIAGYLPLRKLLEGSKGYQEQKAKGFKESGGTLLALDSMIVDEKANIVLAPVTNKQIETKAITTATAGALVAPDRLDVLVKINEFRQLRIRNLLPQGTTVSNVVQYFRELFVDATAWIAEGAAKPESDKQFDLVDANVRELAHHMLVTDTILADAGQLEGIIRTNLIYGVQNAEDRDLIWGTGANNQILGIMNAPGLINYAAAIGAVRGLGTDTLLDNIRRAMTNLMLLEYPPTGLTIHPICWETIELLKATDNNYLWVTVPEGGQPRVWRLPVVETTTMANPADATELHILVGAWNIGAQIFDREREAVEIGWINDDFTRNRRRMRISKRLAFPIYRPSAFVDIICQEGAS